MRIKPKLLGRKLLGRKVNPVKPGRPPKFSKPPPEMSTPNRPIRDTTITPKITRPAVKPTGRARNSNLQLNNLGMSHRRKLK